VANALPAASDDQRRRRCMPPGSDGTSAPAAQQAQQPAPLPHLLTSPKSEAASLRKAAASLS
jgi:hypothetical protein